jgi:protein phosphatase
VALWLGVLAAVVVAALVGTRLYVDGQWYVGESQGRVAVYNGIPTAVFGYKLSHVDQLTGLSAAQAELLQPWKGLKDGITASSKADAERVVTQISQDLSQSKTGAGG